MEIVSADRVITGDGSTVIEQGAVVLQNNRIEAVGRKDELCTRYPEAEYIELPGCSLLPGLIDMHVHLAYYYDENQASRMQTDYALRAFFTGKRMQDTLKAGVTTVRDMCSPDGIASSLKQAAEEGYLQIPRIFTSHKALCITGGHSYGMTGAIVEVDGAAEVRKAVRQNLKDGADWIKLMDSEGFRGEEFTQEELDTAVTEAHRFGKKVAAHAGCGASIPMCIKAGCDSIEHGTHLTVEEAEQMQKQGQIWVPTIYAFRYFYEQMKSNKDGAESGALICYLEDAVSCYRNHFKEIYDTGVLVVTGTDTDCCNQKKASPVAEECLCMVECGLTPLEAISCATSHGAKALGMEEQLGVLQEGYLADMIAVRGNPSVNIDALTEVEKVWQEGICIYESESAGVCQ